MGPAVLSSLRVLYALCGYTEPIVVLPQNTVICRVVATSHEAARLNALRVPSECCDTSQLLLCNALANIRLRPTERHRRSSNNEGFPALRPWFQSLRPA